MDIVIVLAPLRKHGPKRSYTEDRTLSFRYGLIDKFWVLFEGHQDSFGRRFKETTPYLSSSTTNPSIRATAKRLLAILEAEVVRAELVPTTSTPDALLPHFELGQEDRDRMLKLCSDIRKILTGSSDFDHPNKVRLLNRIAAMENEIHRDKGRFDVFLGALNDFGEAAGKFGVDVKPLTDRVREVVGIARRNTSEYDQLPSPDEVKRLPSPDEADGDEQ